MMTQKAIMQQLISESEYTSVEVKVKSLCVAQVGIIKPFICINHGQAPCGVFVLVELLDWLRYLKIVTTK